LSASRGQLQSKFKHADDFGVTGNYNNANAALFDDAIQVHVNSPDVLTIPGTYRGTTPVIHSVDPVSGLNVVRSRTTGEFITGWQLNPDQLWNVLNRGSL